MFTFVVPSFKICNFLLLSERKILARYNENLMFEEASLCAAIESLKTDEFVMCPVCKRCEVIYCHLMIEFLSSLLLGRLLDSSSFHGVKRQLNQLFLNL